MLQRTVTIYRDSFAGLSRDIWLLALVTLVNRSGTMVIPFMTVYLTQQLHFSLAEAGYVMSCFGIGSVVGSLLGGRLTDRYSYYQTMFWTLFLNGAMFLVLMRMQTLLAICLTIFVLSLIADAFRPALFASVAAYSRPENRTRSYSLLRLAINLGFSFGPALGGWIAALKGYHWLFWLDGLTCMGAAILFRLALRNKKEPDESSGGAILPVVSSAYRDRTYLWFIFFVCLGAIAFMQFFSTIPVFYKEVYQFSDAHIGTLLGLNGLLVALLEMPIVHRLDGRSNRLRLVSIGTLLVGLSYLLFILFGFWAGITIVSVFVITLGEIFNMPFANAAAINRSTPRNRGQYMALYTMVYSVALIVAPTAGLQLAEAFGFNALWWVLMGLCLIGSIGIVYLKDKM